jgi:hypothetical protein
MHPIIYKHNYYPQILPFIFTDDLRITPCFRPETFIKPEALCVGIDPTTFIYHTLTFMCIFLKCECLFLSLHRAF